MLVEEGPGDSALKLPKQNALRGFVRCDPCDPDVEYIASYYGLKKDFPLNQLISRDQHMKKIHFLSRGASDFLYADHGKQVNYVTLGVLLFLRNVSKFSNTECIYRIAHDGVENVLPFMTKRCFSCDIALFKTLVVDTQVKVSEIESEELRKELEKLSIGCFVLKCAIGDRIEPLTMHKHPRHIQNMLSRSQIESIKLRFGFV